MENAPTTAVLATILESARHSIQELAGPDIAFIAASKGRPADAGGVIGTVVNTTSELVSNITASSPSPAKSVSKGAAKAPSAYWFGTDGGDLFLSSDGTWSYSDSKYAAPVAIVLLLLLRLCILLAAAGGVEVCSHTPLLCRDAAQRSLVWILVLVGL